jgi:hypothetical protein
MINEIEDQNSTENTDTKPVDENGGLILSSAIKIFDPNTSEVLVQIRGDN